MDKNDFFRQGTLRICGTLEIEEALFSSLHFLKSYMPVDWMSLQLYETSLGAMRTLATANLKETHTVDILSPVPLSAQKEIERSIRLKLIKVQQSVIHTDMENIYSNMIRFHKLKASSIMVLPLESNGIYMGSLTLISSGPDHFTEEHADLLFTLKEPFVIALSNSLRYREIIKLKTLLSDDNHYLHDELRKITGDNIIGANFGLKDVMEKVYHVASMDSPVLLLGETGVGKDVIANAIHYASSRKDGSFVKINCGAIPESLIDSELFGHEKGAFTGAVSRKRGRFERAHKGTIFLDEIGELPLQAQVKLLRVLQHKEIERVGGDKTITLDVRFIAATNRDLEEMVNAKQFREDFWFRLNVFPIVIPPLRERKSDIPALLQHFITKKAKELKLAFIPVLKPGAIDPLIQYEWKGNVRELENIIERALILNPNGPLIFPDINHNSIDKHIRDEMPLEKWDTLDNFSSEYIKRVLKHTHGKINGSQGAAKILDINPNTLRNRMKKLGISYGRKK